MKTPNRAEKEDRDSIERCRVKVEAALKEEGCELQPWFKEVPGPEGWFKRVKGVAIRKKPKK